MIRRTWLVWTIYSGCLLLALPALAWLTSAALQLERSERAARAAAEHEKQIRLASWRIDTRLMPLISQEAARPFADYGPLVRLETRIPPLSSAPSDYVLSYFQGRDGSFQISPPRLAPSVAIAVDANRSPNTPADPAPSRMGRKALDERRLLAQAFRELDPPPEASPADQQVVAQAVQAPIRLNIRPQVLKSQAAAQSQQDGDYTLRQQAFESNAELENVKQRSNRIPAAALPANIREGLSRPLWIGDDLVLARRVKRGDREILQGCWFDWPKLRSELQAEVADLLPTVQLLPTAADGPTNFAHSLATLPVQLVVPSAAPPSHAWTPLQVGLAGAWVGFALAAIAAAGILAGMIALNRRREAFVSAVTHELRTPLTTFRMYSEMLDAGMVTDAQRHGYIHTLRVEADRLWHLVENVLAYARIERGRRAAREHVTLSQLWNRIEPRLHDRAAAADMQLTASMGPGAGEVTLLTDPAAVEQILFNLVDNACKYAAAGQQIRIELSGDQKRAGIHVHDQGPGIPSGDVRKLFRPFAKSAARAAATAPGVGLGLSLCRDLARQLGGDLRYEKAAQGGATFILELKAEG